MDGWSALGVDTIRSLMELEYRGIESWDIMDL
jgi:hypothetical protein